MRNRPAAQRSALHSGRRYGALVEGQAGRPQMRFPHLLPDPIVAEPIAASAVVRPR
jgi:hypothetical protein